MSMKMELVLGIPSSSVTYAQNSMNEMVKSPNEALLNRLSTAKTQFEKLAKTFNETKKANIDVPNRIRTIENNFEQSKINFHALFNQTEQLLVEAKNDTLQRENLNLIRETFAKINTDIQAITYNITIKKIKIKYSNNISLCLSVVKKALTNLDKAYKSFEKISLSTLHKDFVENSTVPRNFNISFENLQEAKKIFTKTFLTLEFIKNLKQTYSDINFDIVDCLKDIHINKEKLNKTDDLSLFPESGISLFYSQKKSFGIKLDSLYQSISNQWNDFCLQLDEVDYRLAFYKQIIIPWYAIAAIYLEVATIREYMRNTRKESKDVNKHIQEFNFFSLQYCKRLQNLVIAEKTLSYDPLHIDSSIDIDYATIPHLGFINKKDVSDEKNDSEDEFFVIHSLLEEYNEIMQKLKKSINKRNNLISFVTDIETNISRLISQRERIKGELQDVGTTFAQGFTETLPQIFRLTVQEFKRRSKAFKQKEKYSDFTKAYGAKDEKLAAIEDSLSNVKEKVASIPTALINFCSSYLGSSNLPVIEDDSIIENLPDQEVTFYFIESYIEDQEVVSPFENIVFPPISTYWFEKLGGDLIK